jgi:hypothetical protein
MFILSISVAIIMCAAALLHFYWAFGGSYGVNSSAPRLERKSQFKPGRMLTFFVACLLMGLAILAVQLTLPWQPIKKLVPYVGYFVSVVLVIRAIGDFRYVGIFKKKYNSSFAKLDTKYFSPLILFLGLAYAVLSGYST